MLRQDLKTSFEWGTMVSFAKKRAKWKSQLSFDFGSKYHALSVVFRPLSFEWFCNSTVCYSDHAVYPRNHLKAEHLESLIEYSLFHLETQ